jgi:hypothetical protein
VSGGDIQVRLTFPLLPCLGPEPGLVGGDGDGRTNLEDAVVAFCDVDLSAGPVELVLAPQLRWQREQPAGLQRQIAVEGV